MWHGIQNHKNTMFMWLYCWWNVEKKKWTSLIESKWPDLSTKYILVYTWTFDPQNSKENHHMDTGNVVIFKKCHKRLSIKKHVFQRFQLKYVFVKVSSYVLCTFWYQTFVLTLVKCSNAKVCGFFWHSIYLHVH